MKESFYFPHDYNARNDQRVLALRGKFGNEGYALYFYLLETMAEEKEGYIYRDAIGGLSVGYSVAIDTLSSFIDYCLSIELFKNDGEKRFFSPRMLEHKQQRAMFSEKGKEGAEKRWGTQKNSPPISKERKGKEKKVGKTGRKSKFVAPSLDEVKAYFRENGYLESVGEKAWKSYNVANWIDSRGNEIKNWKQKMMNVWFDEKNKAPVKLTDEQIKQIQQAMRKEIEWTPELKQLKEIYLEKYG